MTSKSEQEYSLEKIEKLFFFIHAPSKQSSRNMLKPNDPVEANWRQIAADEGKNHSYAFCVIQGNEGDPELVRIARDTFGDRCFVDPYDDSPEVRLQIAEDRSPFAASYGGR